MSQDLTAPVTGVYQGGLETVTYIDHQEPNNDISGARDVYCNTIFGLTLNPSGDVDYYRLRIMMADPRLFSISNLNLITSMGVHITLDSEVEGIEERLLDSSLNVVGKFIRSRYFVASHEYDLSPGTYYIEVSGTGEGDYDMQIQCGQFFVSIIPDIIPPEWEVVPPIFIIPEILVDPPIWEIRSIVYPDAPYTHVVNHGFGFMVEEEAVVDVLLGSDGPALEVQVSRIGMEDMMVPVVERLELITGRTGYRYSGALEPGYLYIVTIEGKSEEEFGYSFEIRPNR